MQPSSGKYCISGGGGYLGMYSSVIFQFFDRLNDFFDFAILSLNT
jgi:hypothetical protein